MMSDALRAVILGIVEGVTEFLPVSSTGHLLLAERFFDLGEGSFWNSFTVLIQLGAILAIVVIYFVKLWQVALGMFSNAEDRRFVIGLLVAFLPAAVIGLRCRKLHQGVSVQSVGGVFFADRRRRDPVVGRSARSRSARTRCHDVSAADVSRNRVRAVPCDDSRRVTLRRQHRRGDAVRRRQARRGGVFVLPGDPDHGRRVRLRFLQEPRRHDDRSHRASSRSDSWCRSSPRSSW